MIGVCKSFIHREMLRFVRQRGRLIATLATPFIFWMVLGLGFGSLMEQTHVESKSLTYFFPGVLLLTVVFSSVFSMISLIQDRNEGFLQGMRLIPNASQKIVWGKVSASTFMALVQSLLVFCLFPLAGISLSLHGVVVVFILLVLASLMMSLIGFAFAWYLNSVQGFHGVMNMVILPLWVLSGALFPYQTAHGVIQAMMALNPLRLFVDAMHACFKQTFYFSSLFQENLWGWIGVGVLIIGLGLVCNYMVRHSGQTSQI